MAPPLADSVKANFRAVMLGREGSEMAPFFRAGLLFQGYLFSCCGVPRAVVDLGRTARMQHQMPLLTKCIERRMNRLSAAGA